VWLNGSAMLDIIACNYVSLLEKRKGGGQETDDEMISMQLLFSFFFALLFCYACL
jgi:hypothetical protein